MPEGLVGWLLLWVATKTAMGFWASMPGLQTIVVQGCWVPPGIPTVP